MRTWTVRPGDIERKWYIVDANDLVLGRLATQVATVLRGKHRPQYSPQADCGDHVIIINADKVEVLRVPTTCASDYTTVVCDVIAVKVTFNVQPASGVFAFKAVDERNRSTVTYFNDGIEVLGESLNAPEVVLVSTPDRNHRGLVELTQVGDRYDNLWSSEDGYTFELNSSGTFILVDSPELEARTDSGSPDTRSHSEFETVKAYEAERAKYLYWNAEYNLSDLPQSFAYEFPTEDSRTQFLTEHDMIGFVRGQ